MSLRHTKCDRLKEPDRSAELRMIGRFYDKGVRGVTYEITFTGRVLFKELSISHLKTNYICLA